ncbi:type I-F CRISPR-associated endoribonuclease Cas6/Csy4 [Methylomonas sp. AM2-LC]|uniref:type I-F CRISPR-associated endoribonuclease Cas6/Csy4 n=1 Tax=Methylomonas sp. AM2-LC TaxID=3153301 RepID=UPI003266CEAF
MERYYQDITILPDADTSPHFIMGRLYQAIHIGLVEQLDEYQNSPIGLTFPEYSAEKRRIGNKVRLIGPKSVIETFNAQKRLESLSDYVHATGIRAVPGEINRFGSFFRIRKKDTLSLPALARRKAKRKNISYEEALKILSSTPEPKYNNPFQWLKSSSNGTKFRLEVGYEETNAINTHDTGFSSYGLSRKGALNSLPIF